MACIFFSILAILFIFIPIFNEIRGVDTNFYLLASQGVKQALLFATVISLITYFVYVKGK